MKVAALFTALLCLGISPARAQAPAPVNVEPLQRRISVHLRDVSLRDALDNVAALAGIRLSYSGDNLPLDRRVSVSRDTATVADVLDELLRTFPVEPVVVANDHVVLTPRDPSMRDSEAHGIAVLDRVVVTGSVIAASERPLPVALDVVRGRDAERRAESDLSKVLDGAVPGVWMWEQAPSSMMARYGSIRGASSFSLSYPKVYVDGIQVANPLLLTQITPEIVERVEVIRGPQGAALYGSDAISGVVNIVSRHEGTAPDGSHTLIRSEAGYASAYNSVAVPVQEHTVSVRGGSNLRSAGLTVGVATSGEYVPDAYSRELKTVASTRVVGPHSAFTANARFYAKNAGVPPNPLLVGLNPDRFGADSNPQQLRMYAIGSTLTVAPTDRWTYTMTAGLDGYALANFSNELAPIPSAADTALRDASGSATRGTVRASAVTSLGTPERIGATLTLAGEQSVLRDRTAGELSLGQIAGTEPDDKQWAVGWSSNTGVSAQGNLALFNALYASAGLRKEYIGQARGLPMSAMLPMLGVAYVHDYGIATVKLRGAYGKGIRAPRASPNFASRISKMLANPNLAPEEQAGTEFGVDLILAGRLGIHVTRFDQLASGLIQTTVFVIDSTGSGGPGKRPVFAYQLQNVGEISNRGWEGQASFSLRSLSLAGAATFVDSRVQRLAQNYTGDLRPGDRMLAVPARTLSGTASWNGSSFQVSSTISRAFDWINYDRLAIAQALIAASGDARNLSGSKLRPYWARYPGASRLRGALTYNVWRGMALQATGENLLNYQRGEPDTITIVPGRTITIGVRARF